MINSITRLKYRYITCCVALLLIFACEDRKPFEKELFIRDNFFEGTVKAEWLPKPELHRISIYDKRSGREDKIYLPYPVFDLQAGDINGDGHTDFCVGLVKPTPHDSTMNNRLFIFHIDKGYIRPLWLGSWLRHRFVGFRVINNNAACRVRAIEIIDYELYTISEYKWQSFGLKFTRTIGDSLTLSEAQRMMKIDE